MPTRVYSTRFVHSPSSSAATATAATYTVPANMRAVVRSIDVYVDTVGLTFVNLRGGTFAIPLVSTSGLAELANRHWDGDAVLNAGDQITVGWVTGAARVTASGFLFNVP